MDLQVPVHRLLAEAAGRRALHLETVHQVADRLREGVRDSREMPLVAGNQCRVRLGCEMVREVERAGRQRVHVISSDAGRSYDPGFCCTTRVLRQDPLAAIR